MTYLAKKNKHIRHCESPQARGNLPLLILTNNNEDSHARYTRSE